MLSTHVRCQITRLTKTFLANITFIRFLVRVNTHVYGQIGWIIIQLLQKKTVIFSNQIHVSSLRRGHAIGVIELISTARCNELRNVVPNLLCIFIRLTNAIAEAMATD